MQLQSRQSINAKFKKGYTLIEILVALSIVGLLFSFGFVSFRDFSRRQALSGTAKGIQGDLRLAQQQALSGKKPSSTLCDAPANSLSSFSFNVYSTTAYKIQANCSGGDVTIRDVSIPTGITISSPTNPIKFKVIGQGTNLPDGGSAQITISQTGTTNQAIITVTDGGEIQ